MLAFSTQATTRNVRCYHCGHRFDVAPKAQMLTCSGCYRRVNVEDVKLTREVQTDEIKTAGRVYIGPRARVIASQIQGGAGVDIEGIVQAEVTSWKRVAIGPAAWFRGSCAAPTVHIAPGAQVDGAAFRVGTPGI